MGARSLIALPQLDDEHVAPPPLDGRDAVRLVAHEDERVPLAEGMRPQLTRRLESSELTTAKVDPRPREHHVNGVDGAVVLVLHPRKRAVDSDGVILDAPWQDLRAWPAAPAPPPTRECPSGGR